MGSFGHRREIAGWQLSYFNDASTEKRKLLAPIFQRLSDLRRLAPTRRVPRLETLMATSPTELLTLSWKESDIESSLAVLRRYVETEAQRQIDWYRGKRAAKAALSSTLRFAAGFFFFAGGLVPILKATLKPEMLQNLPFDFGESGYLLIAIGGGTVALDRFFGFSSSWIRCITATLAIEKSLEEFRMEWARYLAKLRGGVPPDSLLDQLIVTCETFSLAIRGQVEEETQSWVNEFQSNLLQLERDLEAKADEVKAKMNP